MISKNKKRIVITLTKEDLKRLKEIQEELNNMKMTKSQIIASAIYEYWRDLL